MLKLVVSMAGICCLDTIAPRGRPLHSARVGAKKRRVAQQSRQLKKELVDELERLAASAPGGAPDRPIEIETPAVIDMRAVAQPCPLCEGVMKLEEHAATAIDGIRLRVAAVVCTTCGVRRRRYFHLAAPTLH